MISSAEPPETGLGPLPPMRLRQHIRLVELIAGETAAAGESNAAWRARELATALQEILQRKHASGELAALELPHPPSKPPPNTGV